MLKRWALLACLLAAPAAGDYRSPVHYLKAGDYRCSAVVTSSTRALTAAHCMGHGTLKLDGWLVVTAAQLGPDLAELHPRKGRFPAPYARPAPAGPQLLVEGYGCQPDGAAVYERSMRRAVLLDVHNPEAGAELAFVGQVCGGDSGGALWTDRGGLAGILTRRQAYHGMFWGYATPAR